MREPGPRLGSIQTKILLPWLVLTLLVLVLAGYRYYQTQELARMANHSQLHRQATRLAYELSLLTQVQLGNVLAYHAIQDPQLIKRFKQREEETDRKIAILTHLFDHEEHYGHRLGSSDELILDSYQLLREGQRSQYDSLLSAIATGNLKRQTSLIPLLVDRARMVRAALADLTHYHGRTETRFAEDRDGQELRSNNLLLVLLGALVLVGLVFSWIQTRSIVRPLLGLTNAAQVIGSGGIADLERYSGQDEIGDLSKALSAMVIALRRSRQEILDQQDQLVQAYAEVEDRVIRRTAELTRRTAELEKAIKELEGFSYSVSHDLRAPLRAIDGFIAILLEDYAEHLDAEGQRLFGIVSANARKMGHLIDDILALSRAGRLELAPTPVDMNVLVAEVWDSLAEQRGERPIAFQPGELPTVWGDPRALRQVWQNLLGNAIKFTRDCQPARIEVSAEQGDDLIWFSVKDNGAGFRQDYQDKLFVLFQRLHGMEEFEGTGVGLAIVKRFIERHGGQVRAEGEVGAGATFRFGLPANPDQGPS